MCALSLQWGDLDQLHGRVSDANQLPDIRPRVNSIFHCVRFCLIVRFFLSCLLYCISGFGKVRYPLPHPDHGDGCRVAAALDSNSAISGCALKYFILSLFPFMLYLCRIAILWAFTVVFPLPTSCPIFYARSILFSIVLDFL